MLKHVQCMAEALNGMPPCNCTFDAFLWFSISLSLSLSLFSSLLFACYCSLLALSLVLSLPIHTRAPSLFCLSLDHLLLFFLLLSYSYPPNPDVDRLVFKVYRTGLIGVTD